MDHDRLAKSDFLYLGILAGVCLLLGIYLIVSRPLMANDGVFYIEQARRVVSDPLAVTRRHPPGYPLLVWAAHALTNRFAAGDAALLWVRSAQGVTLLCRILALVPLYFLGRRLVGPRDSFRALLILAVLPYPAYYGSDVLREWPYVLFLSVGFWMLYRGLQEGTWWPFAVAGLAAGLGYLIRPECAQLLIYGAIGLLLTARLPRWGHSALVPDPGDARAPNEDGKGRAFPVRKGSFAALASAEPGWRRAWAWWGAGLLLVAGFALAAVPSIRATGTILPQQLGAARSNAPPVVLRIGSRPAGDEPLEFEVRAGESLEVPIEAFDPEDQLLLFSLVGVPAGSRPVYQFRSVATGARFWTLAENERSTLLAAWCPQVWQYDGVVGYAYPQADEQAGLQPVHRFWSAARQRHFYTISGPEKETLLQAAAPVGTAAHQGSDWQYEGVAFYAFPADRHPPAAVPVYRLGNGPGIADLTRDTNPQSAHVAWYVHGAGEPPAGARVENQVLRWRPRPEQQGEYLLNVIISDGPSSTCQLVQIRVQAPAGPGAETRGPHSDVRAPGGGNSTREFRALNSQDPAPGCQYAGVAQLPEAVDRLFDAIAEDLMVVFLLPWLLGLYYRLRYQADRVERVLVPALLLVNVAAMLARYAWIAPGSNRRYSLGLLALTIFYIPTGLQLIGGWLTAIADCGLRIADWGRRTVRQANPQSSIRHLQSILLAIGIGACVFRLFMAPTVDRSSYRVMARWLRENTAPNAVIAVPDTRISFYADRPAVLYRRQFDPRRVDYAVKVEEKDPPALPPGWRCEYSIPFNRGREGKSLVAYRIPRPAY